MILNKFIKSSGKCIQNVRLILLSLSISGTVKAESNTFYKYECEYTLCVLYKAQTGFCK